MSPETPACGKPSDIPLFRCTKTKDHKGERHTAVVPGIGSYTWGYVPTDEEGQA
ncbi:hypothetical protein [Actinoplanes lobatus]|uniref:Uncharacterized protein n=1 Tax=Actinoplanes lobatus TaxID=113568 RepID=A0A7W7MM91_9ACTN|nr:hypothetical protein [Actinoplanes lobatus]MBB4755328.1 hypothetical protein [Actinoplanes lobatus]GIE46386.1 hypothetical protein Alo02nite_92840 [Actinoplanes lobatus]